MDFLDNTRADQLAAIATELAVRVRDFDPEANGRWLAKVLPDPADWFRLSFVLAAAIPDDRSWRQLTAWTRPEEARPAKPQPKPQTRGKRRPAAKCGTASGARKHWRKGERACADCRASEAKRARQRRAANHQTTRLELAA